MNHKFKVKQKVRLILDPNPEYIEYHTENLPNPEEKPPIKKGSTGEVNLILTNGQYHVEIHNESGQPIAYVPMDEEGLEALDSPPEEPSEENP